MDKSGILLTSQPLVRTLCFKHAYGKQLAICASFAA
jgi:hypothetical protein